MSRNLHCGCLCHGSNGNRIGDEYFSCKGCYAANHMNALPRKVVATKAKPAGPRKPRPRLEVKEGLRKDETLTLNTKSAAKIIMDKIADTAEQLKVASRTETEKRFDLGHRLEPVKSDA